MKHPPGTPAVGTVNVYIGGSVGIFLSWAKNDKKKSESSVCWTAVALTKRENFGERSGGSLNSHSRAIIIHLVRYEMK